ncbi:Vacuolar protein sorting-associated protein 11 [Coelomomyces lativittatus]|nr:Vacuolar protein sorting-associated protein 11 [Coelomomyces lativittatus]
MSQSQELPLSFFKDIPVSFSPNRRLPFVSSTTAPTTPLGYIDHLASSVTSHLCVGFSSGAIALYQGDFLKDKSSPKITFLRDFGARIISLHFHQALFVTTENDILYLPKEQLLPSSTQPLSLVNLDELHGGTHAVASPQVDEVVVVRNTDVHVYNVHGTSYHFSFTSPIQSIHRYFEYLVIITRDPLLLRDTLEIYYLPESLCVYQAHYSHIQYLLPFLRSGLFLYTSETLIRLREKPLKERLQALLTHHLYTVAIRLSSDDPDLHGKYGDYLIQQNNEASALTHYYHTIGHWDSTKVLRKLREPNHLIQFLQWIHEKGEAHQDHTQLLFQCLIQEKKYPDLQTLIHQTNLSFDVQAAIQCCSDHELYALALQLAEKHHQWDLHFELLLKTNSIDDAIVFLNAQPTDQTNELLLRFGRSFLLASPERVTEFLITHVSKTHPDHLTSLVKLYLPHMPQRFLFLKFLLLEYDGRHEINSDVGLWNAFLESAHTLDEALLVLQCPDVNQLHLENY